MEVWHNPACSKCQVAAERLALAGVDFGIRRYLDDPPSAAELEDVLRRLDKQPWQLARMGEPAAAELGLADWPQDESARQRWIAAMVEHPSLIQRPILLLDDGRALLGRTPEAVDEAIEGTGAKGASPTPR
ncbi:MAG: ArsC/Spx/MgsR family protein [Micromonosporaceae bacterium]